MYGEEFIADLCGLISVQPTGPKSDEPHEFQVGDDASKAHISIIISYLL